MKDAYTELNMGYVKSNYAQIHRSEQHLWEARGFVRVLYHKTHFGILNPFKVTMLGVPDNIAEFGVDRIKGYKITGFSCYFGSNGILMPGFCGIRIEKGIDVRWLVYSIWSAASCLLMDDIPILSHDENGKKWIGYDDIEIYEEKLVKLINGSVIDGIELEKTNFCLRFTAPDGTAHRITAREFKPYIKSSPYIKDYLLVIYDGSFLTV